MHCWILCYLLLLLFAFSEWWVSIRAPKRIFCEEFSTDSVGELCVIIMVPLQLTVTSMEDFVPCDI